MKQRTYFPVRHEPDLEFIKAKLQAMGRKILSIRYGAYNKKFGRGVVEIVWTAVTEEESHDVH
jgi:hypothetical protein